MMTGTRAILAASPPEDAGLAAVGVNDEGGPSSPAGSLLHLAFQESGERQEGAQVGPGTHFADQGRDEPCFVASVPLGFVHQEPPGTADEHSGETGRIEVGEGVEGVLLGSAEFQLGNDVNDFQDLRPNLMAVALPCARASSMAEYSQAP